MEKANNIEILSLLNDSEVATFMEILNIREYKKGEVIFHEGARGREMFIVRRGFVGSRTELPDGSWRTLARFRSGDFFGDMSIFENAPRSATCYAIEDSELYRLNDLAFFSFAEKHPEISTKIMLRMLNITTGRLREKSRFLSNMVEWGDSASKRAITDEVTSIYNRRFLDESLERLFKVSENSSRPLSLVMIDIDDFNIIDEQYCNEDVNDIIRTIVVEIKKNLRDNDILARYGGDEFSIIFPETDIDTACEIAEKICSDVSTVRVMDKKAGKERFVTISVGVSSYPRFALTLDDLMKSSDQALYNAKSSGKNRVETME